MPNLIRPRAIFVAFDLDRIAQLLARIRRDAQLLLDDNEIAVDGPLLRLCRFAHAHQAVQTLERPRAKTDAERQQLLRDREKASRELALESSRNVTNVTAERDGFRDDRHDTSVTRPRSFKEDLDLKSLRERETVTAVVTATRDAVPEVTNQLLWDSAKAPAAPKSAAKTADVEASWIRKAMGET